MKVDILKAQAVEISFGSFRILFPFPFSFFFFFLDIYKNIIEERFFFSLFRRDLSSLLRLNILFFFFLIWFIDLFLLSYFFFFFFFIIGRSFITSIYSWVSNAPTKKLLPNLILHPRGQSFLAERAIEPKMKDMQWNKNKFVLEEWNWTWHSFDLLHQMPLFKMDFLELYCVNSLLKSSKEKKKKILKFNVYLQFNQLRIFEYFKVNIFLIFILLLCLKFINYSDIIIEKFIFILHIIPDMVN